MEKKKNVFQSFISGVIAGIVDVSITHPLWTTQVLYQDGLSKNKILNSIKKNPMILYSGVLQNASSLIPLTCTRLVLDSALKNYSQENSKNELSIFTKLKFSFTAGSVSSLISSPIELIRTIKVKSTIAEHSSINNNFFKIANGYIKTEGIIKLYNGLPAVSLRDGLYTSIFLSGPQVIQEKISPYFKNNISSIVVSYSCTSIIASAISTPFDTIKTIQHLNASQSYLNGPNKTCTFIESCQNIYNSEGLKGFYKGYSTRGTRLAIGFIIKAAIIDKMDEYWDKYNNQINDLELIGDTNSIHHNDSDEY